MIVMLECPLTEDELRRHGATDVEISNFFMHQKSFKSRKSVYFRLLLKFFWWWYSPKTKRIARKRFNILLEE